MFLLYRSNWLSVGLQSSCGTRRRLCQDSRTTRDVFTVHMKRGERDHLFFSALALCFACSRREVRCPSSCRESFPSILRLYTSVVHMECFQRSKWQYRELSVVLILWLVYAWQSHIWRYFSVLCTCKTSSPWHHFAGHSYCILNAIDLKKYKQARAAFLPWSRMITGAARPF